MPQGPSSRQRRSCAQSNLLSVPTGGHGLIPRSVPGAPSPRSEASSWAQLEEVSSSVSLPNNNQQIASSPQISEFSDLGRSHPSGTPSPWGYGDPRNLIESDMAGMAGFDREAEDPVVPSQAEVTADFDQLGINSECPSEAEGEGSEEAAGQLLLSSETRNATSAHIEAQVYSWMAEGQSLQQLSRFLSELQFPRSQNVPASLLTDPDFIYRLRWDPTVPFPLDSPSREHNARLSLVATPERAS